MAGADPKQITDHVDAGMRTRPSIQWVRRERANLQNFRDILQVAELGLNGVANAALRTGKRRCKGNKPIEYGAIVWLEEVSVVGE